MRERLRAIQDRFRKHVQKYWTVWLVVALLEDRVMNWANATLDSFATQYQWTTGIRDAVLWFDRTGLGFIGNLVVLTLLFILWRSYQDTRRNTHSIPLSPEASAPKDTTQEHSEYAEQKERFLNFAEQSMINVCNRMQFVSHQIHGMMWKQGGIPRLCVEVSKQLMSDLKDQQEDTSAFLREKSPLSNNDFVTAQNLLVRLYNTYEKRRPWMNDAGLETIRSFTLNDYYKEWEAADVKMRKQLKELLRDCGVLADKITNLDPYDPRRWNKRM